MNATEVIDLIFSELRKAEAKHTGWPDDKIHAVAIVMEEAGEAMKEAIDLTYSPNEREIINRLKVELAQTGAMAIRALVNLSEDSEANQR